MRVKISEDLSSYGFASWRTSCNCSYIYDKSDFENITEAFLRDILKRMD